MLCRHTDILEDGTLRDNGNRNYEFVVRTIATVGNYGKSNWTPLPDALVKPHGMIGARASEIGSMTPSQAMATCSQHLTDMMLNAT